MPQYSPTENSPKHRAEAVTDEQFSSPQRKSKRRSHYQISTAFDVPKGMSSICTPSPPTQTVTFEQLKAVNTLKNMFLGVIYS